MDKILRGNFTPKKTIIKEKTGDDSFEKFEKEALKRLGGSIAFVSKKGFLYGVEKDKRDAKT